MAGKDPQSFERSDLCLCFSPNPPAHQTRPKVHAPQASASEEPSTLLASRRRVLSVTLDQCSADVPCFSNSNHKPQQGRIGEVLTQRPEQKHVQKQKQKPRGGRTGPPCGSQVTATASQLPLLQSLSIARSRAASDSQENPAPGGLVVCYYVACLDCLLTWYVAV